MILRYAFEKLFKAREATNKRRQAKAGADEGYDPYEKPFLDHLEDLRKTLGKMLILICVTTVISFAFNVQIFKFVQLPAKLAVFEDGTTLLDKISMFTLKPQEILMLSIKTSFIAALIVSFPLLVWFAGEFIMPGLKQSEKRYVIPGVGVGFVLFLTGVCFAFFLAAPIALKFFYTFSLERFGTITPPASERVLEYEPVQLLHLSGESPAPETGAEPKVETATESKPESDVTQTETPPAGPPKPEVEVDPETKLAIRTYLSELLVVEKGSQLSLTYDKDRDKLVISNQPNKPVSYQIGEYINFITRLTLVFGISFQLPVVVVILVKLELLTARVMRNTRSYAWVVILVAAAIFTPPDVFTLALLGGPLILLYEICIWIAWGIERRREKDRAAEEQERQERYAALMSKSHDDMTEAEKEELHRQEVEQYEREHAHLYEEESSHIPHDPHATPDHDEHGHPYDPDHDAGWHDEYDPGHDPFHHDYHADEPAHEPVQDWPDHEGAETESDHVAGKDIEDSDSKDPQDDASFAHDDEVCEPDGPVVHLNSATEEELLTLPGVGPAMAKRLIENRPYRSFDDVSNVPGIGDSKLYAMIERLSIDDPEEDEEKAMESDLPPSTDEPSESQDSDEPTDDSKL